MQGWEGWVVLGGSVGVSRLGGGGGNGVVGGVKRWGNSRCDARAPVRTGLK